MSARMLPPANDPVRPGATNELTIVVDGEPLTGLAGQTIAGVALANGRLEWRRTSAQERPRGLFCGIGVCFDCIVTVNGSRDVRACQRRAADGDVITTQHDELPEAHHG
ncbi:(2Fe-2S)-binding protein [Agromyces aerolatus]|uniref:(2Fe-2S)-binding protein n=1 Tax=Agromyces sp. LY-1074 TaxID=3074080 RepID=UPI002861C233|nr:MULTISPECIES: (2Fe-2S)-binding protein [unclassified Agromyces]MDR5701565.1 (2Fe-2S)-binding protein [Agromyces sp. LY-1074]MDR5707828.1 (2Fe-2S)-binding protein [Agromyces sp. LY-1358]